MAGDLDALPCGEILISGGFELDDFLPNGVGFWADIDGLAGAFQKEFIQLDLQFEDGFFKFEWGW